MKTYSKNKFLSIIIVAILVGAVILLSRSETNHIKVRPYYINVESFLFLGSQLGANVHFVGNV